MSELTPEQLAEFEAWLRWTSPFHAPDAARMAWKHQQAKIDALTKERDVLREVFNGLKIQFDQVLLERDAALAELAKMREQKPVGYANPLHIGIEMTTLWTRKFGANDVPLYSQPVPASPEIAKVELNMGDMLASCDLMAPVPAASEGEGK